MVCFFFGRPAPGYHRQDMGALYCVGYGGYSWSSPFCSTNGMHLGFDVAGLNPGSASSRAYGFQLRCLSE